MLGKPERGKMVENMILQMAQTGQIGQQLEESDLIRILEQISNNDRFSKATTVKVKILSLKYFFSNNSHSITGLS